MKNITKESVKLFLLLLVGFALLVGVGNYVKADTETPWMLKEQAVVLEHDTFPDMFCTLAPVSINDAGKNLFLCQEYFVIRSRVYEGTPEGLLILQSMAL